MSPSISSISARTGVIPIPPATSSTFSRVREASVKTPNGPSATTRVPGLSRSIRAQWLPKAFAVIRSLFPSGAAEIENGSGAHQKPGVRKRQMKNWPGRTWSLSRRRPTIVSETTPGASTVTSRDPHPVPERVDQRHRDPPREQQQRDEVEAAPVPLRQGDVDDVVAGRDLMKPAERDPRVRREMNPVPELVRQPPPRKRNRGHHHQHQQPGADGGGDHPGSTPPQISRAVSPQ